MQAKTGKRRSSTFSCLFHNNLSFKIIIVLKRKLLWNKQGKPELRRGPILACSTLVTVLITTEFRQSRL